MRPLEKHWDKLGRTIEFDVGRVDTLENKQGSASQYLLAYSVWQFAKNFIPGAQRYREQALEEGVRAGKIDKASGSIVSPQGTQENYLATNLNYQIWRLMANMKELLVEATSHLLVQKYGSLDSTFCLRLLESFDLKNFLVTADLKEVAQHASSADDLGPDLVFSRIFGFLKHVSTQFWEEKQKQLQATSRLRTVLLNRQMAADFKRKMEEANSRRALDKPWKPEGQTFLESLPSL